MFAILSFYSFVHIEDLVQVQSKLLYWSKRKNVQGTVILASEGFNGSLSGQEESLRFILAELSTMTGASDVNVKVNYWHLPAYDRLKIKIKKEIIALGISDLDVNGLKGEYIPPAQWDEFIADEEVAVIDVRNDYEVAVGSFEGAINPQTETFKQFVDWAKNNQEQLQNKKIAMFCTGGIRCEKSTALLRSLGHKQVYHLHGGILGYLAETGNTSGKWHGDCFVFDERRQVDDQLQAM